MKKLVALLLAVMMLSVSVLALAEAPEGYPEVQEGIDFGGQTVSIYTWYDMNRAAEPTQEEQDLYDYQDWLMATYNVKIEYVNKYAWDGADDDLINFTGNPDASVLCLYTFPNDFIATPMANNLLAPLEGHIDVTADKWFATTTEFMTKNGHVYGLFNGQPEVRECIYFNKRILEDAGIDWNTIYDMQAEGTWTWDAFEELLKATQKDVDNDGVIDIWGMTGSRDDMVFAAVYGNDATFFDYDENGLMTVTAGSDNALEALNWVSRIYDEYFFKGIPAEDGSVAWDYYKEAWKQGVSAFRAGQTWEGFNDVSEMDGMEDEWGCVAFPKGPKGTDYINLANNNIVVIPNVYDDETLAKLCFIYDQWTNPTPGYEDDEEAWIGNKYNKTDDRAVDETYAMLRQADHLLPNYQLLLGDKNELMGNSLLWQLGNGNDPAALVEAATPAWQAVCDTFNGK
ncbi:MAG: hypothetical protein E7319_00385 [Clostridiales bacterium]|nr:hypothetical protein [Clostridiales bacterium]